MPLIVRWPGHVEEGRRVSTQVGVVDVAPTLADLAGMELLAEPDGHSLADDLAGGTPRAARALYGFCRRISSLPATWSVREPDWKLVRSEEGREELYHLASDPRELRNVIASESEVAGRLRALLTAHLTDQPPVSDVQRQLSDEARRALEALGYIE